MAVVSALGRMWLEAAKDLGLRVTAPFVLDNGMTTEPVMFDALVADFGSRNGMALMEQWSQEKADAASAAGYGYSCMDAGVYERSNTIEALEDWGWCGSGAAPKWLNAAT